MQRGGARERGRKEVAARFADRVFRFQHIPELDGFRGLAVLVVLAGHHLEFRMPNPRPEFVTIDKLLWPRALTSLGVAPLLFLRFGVAVVLATGVSYFSMVFRRDFLEFEGATAESK